MIKDHWTAAWRILRYLRGTSTLGLKYKKVSQKLKGFVDADWAGRAENWKSYTAVFVLAHGAASREAKKQRTVVLSSTEAEYMILMEVAKEATHLQRFLQEVGLAKKPLFRFITIIKEHKSLLKIRSSTLEANVLTFSITSWDRHYKKVGSAWTTYYQVK